MSVLTFRRPIPGRRVDVTVLQTATPFSNTVADQTLWQGDGGLACTGIYKLAQQVLIYLLTPVDSQPYTRSKGTQLIPAVFGGQLRTAVDVRRVFAVSRQQVLSEFFDAVPQTAYPDEQLADLQLLNVRIGGGELELDLQLTSRSGDSLVFIAPIGLN